MEFDLLGRNVEANGYENVITVRKAVSDKTGKAKLYCGWGNQGDHRTYDTHDGRKTIDIEAVTLDEFFKEYIGGIDIIKMDIQGTELSAFQGMKNILEKNPKLKIITEFWPIAVRESGKAPAEVLNAYVEAGFRLYLIDTGLESVEIDLIMKKCDGEEFVNLYLERA